MLTADDHRAWAEDNSGLFATLGAGRPPRHWDAWATTVLFYAGVHWTQSLLVSKGIEVAEHAERQRALRNQPAWSDVEACYASLKQQSEDGRYRCIRHSADQINRAEQTLLRLQAEVRKLT